MWPHKKNTTPSEDNNSIRPSDSISCVGAQRQGRYSPPLKRPYVTTDSFYPRIPPSQYRRENTPPPTLSPEEAGLQERLRGRLNGHDQREQYPTHTSATHEPPSYLSSDNSSSPFLRYQGQSGFPNAFFHNQPFYSSAIKLGPKGQTIYVYHMPTKTKVQFDWDDTKHKWVPVYGLPENTPDPNAPEQAQNILICTLQRNNKTRTNCIWWFWDKMGECWEQDCCHYKLFPTYQDGNKQIRQIRQTQRR
jgi:hypothetical protein